MLLEISKGHVKHIYNDQMTVIASSPYIELTTKAVFAVIEIV